MLDPGSPHITMYRALPAADKSVAYQTTVSRPKSNVIVLSVNRTKAFKRGPMSVPRQVGVERWATEPRSPALSPSSWSASIEAQVGSGVANASGS